ncbi:hypothetical protein Pelo_3013 [Pelomyxa schiedti]|nr:hypothetical protein Pelo_3013 [Pelomyxa schiedti]
MGGSGSTAKDERANTDVDKLNWKWLNSQAALGGTHLLKCPRGQIPDSKLRADLVDLYCQPTFWRTSPTSQDPDHPEYYFVGAVHRTERREEDYFLHLEEMACDFGDSEGRIWDIQHPGLLKVRGLKWKTSLESTFRFEPQSKGRTSACTHVKMREGKIAIAVGNLGPQIRVLVVECNRISLAALALPPWTVAIIPGTFSAERCRGQPTVPFFQTDGSGGGLSSRLKAGCTTEFVFFDMTARVLALMSCLHPRLGSRSPLNVLSHPLLTAIAMLYLSATTENHIDNTTLVGGTIKVTIYPAESTGFYFYNMGYSPTQGPLGSVLPDTTIPNPITLSIHLTPSPTAPLSTLPHEH